MSCVRTSRTFTLVFIHPTDGFVSGESHYYQGHRYLLNVIYHQASPAVVLRNNKTMDLYVRIGSDTAERERVLCTWYRRRLKEEIAPLIAKWEAVIGVKVDN